MKYNNPPKNVDSAMLVRDEHGNYALVASTGSGEVTLVFRADKWKRLVTSTQWFASTEEPKR